MSDRNHSRFRQRRGSQWSPRRRRRTASESTSNGLRSFRVRRGTPCWCRRANRRKGIRMAPMDWSRCTSWSGVPAARTRRRSVPPPGEWPPRPLHSPPSTSADLPQIISLTQSDTLPSFIFSGGFRGGEPATPPPWLRTDAVSHVTLANAEFWSFYCKTWYSEYSKWLSSVISGFLTARPIECTKFVLGRSSAPDLTGGATVLPQTL